MQQQQNKAKDFTAKKLKDCPATQASIALPFLQMPPLSLPWLKVSPSVPLLQTLPELPVLQVMPAPPLGQALRPLPWLLLDVNYYQMTELELRQWVEANPGLINAWDLNEETPVSGHGRGRNGPEHSPR
jgi:hypothetical protein